MHLSHGQFNDVRQYTESDVTLPMNHKTADWMMAESFFFLPYNIYSFNELCVSVTVLILRKVVNLVNYYAGFNSTENEENRKGFNI
jgi:hypothetical protein